MGFLDDLDKATNAIGGVASSLSGNAQQIIANPDYAAEGFVVSTSTPSADGTGLPSAKIRYGLRPVTRKRKLIHWFVPEFGVVKMYINPQSISYNYKKIINKTQTKGGFVVSYWGEELPTLQIQGVTGSSGVEGMNVLYEIYRAEQYAFDSLGLTMAANSNVSGVQNLLDDAGDALFGDDSIAGDIFGGVSGGLLGADPSSGLPLPSNVPTLASLAMGVELYYDGWVFRGYFENLNITESADHIGSFNYTIGFTVTQRRGYRTNYMGWHRSANSGPSDNSLDGIPLTFKGPRSERSENYGSVTHSIGLQSAQRVDETTNSTGSAFSEFGVARRRTILR